MNLAAASFAYEFNTTFSGSAPGPTNVPWVEASFSSTAAGSVSLTISNKNLVGAENLDSLYLNLNPLLNPSKLQFKVIGETGVFAAPTISTGGDKFKASSGGYFDIDLVFSSSGPESSRFTAGESLTLQITGIPTLSAGDFAFLSVPSGNSTGAYAVAKVQRVGSSSGWIEPTGTTPLAPVPEPAPVRYIFFGAGAWLALAVRRHVTRLPPR